MKNTKDGATLHIDCNCGSPEHILRFIWNDEDLELYTEVQLRQWRSLPKRIWVAIRYIFGYKSSYGVWDCTCMGRCEMEKLHNFLGKML